MLHGAPTWKSSLSSCPMVLNFLTFPSSFGMFSSVSY
jgi:hypothetical protein